MYYIFFNRLFKKIQFHLHSSMRNLLLSGFEFEHPYKEYKLPYLIHIFKQMKMHQLNFLLDKHLYNNIFMRNKIQNLEQIIVFGLIVLKFYKLLLKEFKQLRVPNNYLTILDSLLEYFIGEKLQRNHTKLEK